MDAREQRPLHGIGLKLTSVFVFIAMQSMIKATSAHVPAGEAVFFRSFFAIPVIFVWLAMQRQLKDGVKVAAPMGHVWRGVMGTLAMGFGFASLRFLPLPEVTALGYASPLLTVVFAAMFLGEEVRAFRIGCVALGLVGVTVVLSPRLTILDAASATAALGAVMVLVSALFGALAQVHVRRMVESEKTPAIVFWFSFTSTAISLLTIPFGWVMPVGWEWVLLIGAGLLGGVGQILLTSSYRFADASLVAPFDYASMIFSLLIGYFIFDEVPTLVMLAGAAIVILAGILIIWREAQLGIARGKARPAMTPPG
jgi:drug/metabolite transporter (DMT)-like permease